MGCHDLGVREAAEMSVAVEAAAGGEVVVRIEASGATHHVRFSSNAIGSPDVSHAADAALAATLFPAMSTARRLSLSDPVSPRLFAALPVIQDMVRCWEQRYPAYERYQRVEVVAGERDDTALSANRSGRGVAAFFTAGVDSFFTAIRHRHELDALVYVRGFDVRPGNDDLQARVVDGVAHAAEALGIPLLILDTDLRTFADPLAGWDAYHGAALAAVAHVLSNSFHTMHIASTMTYAHLAPLGSHPLLDPMWSSETMQIVHDGAHASRVDKLRFIADELAVKQWLRVCWENRGGEYNCGRCEKCLRTKLALRALGRLDDIVTFSSHIAPGDIGRVTLPEIAYTWQASLALLEARGTDPALAAAVRRRLYSRHARLIHQGRYYARRVRRMVR
jgi:hypothetical protein